MEVDTSSINLSTNTFNTPTTNNNTLDIDPSTFKSTLPPRKRAKTQEEKEQRKIERILRNRRAAHASREKKRRHVEFLEIYVVKLEENLKKLQEGYHSKLEGNDEEKMEQIKLLGLEDVSKLKENIYSNLVSSRRRKNSSNNNLEDDDEEEEEEDDNVDEEPIKKQQVKQETVVSEPPSKKRKMNNRKNSTTSSTPSSIDIKIEESEDLKIKQEESSTFFNYLSPISIHSPESNDFTLSNFQPSKHLQEIPQQQQEETIIPIDQIIKSPLSQSSDSLSNSPRFEEDEENNNSSSSSSPKSQSLNRMDSNLSIFETGQNSAVILSFDLQGSFFKIFNIEKFKKDKIDSSSLVKNIKKFTIRFVAKT
ncbi:HAC1 [Candida pseudojiufengensis]|uniref:HAC1 n=1 Tax=Candida pseudojiufengensis TaxID=497109 RepID=UPI002223F4C0|nr:HAC1 [Candida pseudojiufengensis]KAI5966376.1 HAC1 [Candida pseudojiufengensis]